MRRVLGCAIFISFLLVFAFPAMAYFGETFGGAASDWGSNVEVTSDGGCIFVGSTHSSGAGSSDVWLIKVDEHGNKQWEKTFGGVNADFGGGVDLTSDGGYIVVGATRSYGAGDYDVWLIKTDSNGLKEWDKTIGGTGIDYGVYVIQTSDGGYAVTGYMSGSGGYDLLFLKTDANGNGAIVPLGGAGWDFGSRLDQTSDGGYIIAAYTTSYGAGGRDVWLVKLDLNANKVWDKTFGGTSNDEGLGVEQTADGGYIISGYTASYGAGGDDIWLIKTDGSGNKSWDRTFGGALEDRGYPVEQTADGGYAVAGHTRSYGAGGADAWLVKTDADGWLRWSKTFGGDGDAEDAYGLEQTDDGGYLIVGQTTSYGSGSEDAWLIYVPTAEIDTDEDGYSDAAEVEAASNPNKCSDFPIALDTNHDGMLNMKDINEHKKIGFYVITHPCD